MRFGSTLILLWIASSTAVNFTVTSPSLVHLPLRRCKFAGTVSRMLYLNENVDLYILQDVLILLRG
jgi:hypothetical protein